MKTREYENWFECTGLHVCVSVGNLFTELEDAPNTFTTCIDATYDSGCQWSGEALLTVNKDGTVTTDWRFLEDGLTDEGGDPLDVSDLSEQEATADIDALARLALESASEWLARVVNAD